MRVMKQLDLGVRTTQPAHREAIGFLVAAQNRDGGWGYTAGEPSCVEPTAAAAMALRGEAEATETRAAAGRWLLAVQHRDGGWGLDGHDPESGWLTAWAVLALAAVGGADDAVRRGAAWLRAVKSPAEYDELQSEAQEKARIDISLYGWPWLPDQASWVEPTALALLALGSLPDGAPSAARLDEGARYLTDRRCAGGGWNFGNPVMLGANLPAHACPTAWALLALAQHGRDAIRAEDLATLRGEMARDGGTLALGWGLLALAALDEEDAAAAAHMAGLQSTDGSWNGNPYHTAVAVMAWRGSL
jgi:hypothetical protein